MSWIARSLANSLIPDHRDEDDEEDDREARIEKRSDEDEEENHQIESETLGRGVKEDLSELTKTLTRQFWGVASFLAPPPSSQEPSPTSSVQISSDPSDPTVSRDSEEEEVSESPRIAGIRNDFAEIGGRFRTGISRLSNNKAVSEISKIASTFLPFGSEEDEDEEYDEKYGGGAIGVTDEVLAFARNISMHSETWLDFPLFPVDEDSDDFDMSDAQQEHALAVERLAPRLAALRIELCPSHMSEGCFWKIYFVLLHPRLSKHDAELLSTPQIVEARAMLLQELQNRRKPDSERPATGASYRGEALSTLPPKEEVAMPSSVLLCETAPPIQLAFGEPTISVPITDFETDKHPVITTEVKIIDKSVIEEEPLEKSENKDFHSDDSRISVQRDEEDGDDWLEEETGEMGNSGGTNIPLENEEDVSFSDLEEEDDGSAPKSSKTVTHAINSQTKDSKGWVQLNKSSANAAKGSNSATSPETKESNDWLSVDDIDVV